MFGHFLYFIIALLILSLYQPVENPPLSATQALAALAALMAGFALFARAQFRRLAARVQFESSHTLDQRFSLWIMRLNIIALVLFAVDIWVLDLPSFLKMITWLAPLPTLSELILLLVFIAHLALVWTFAHTAHRAIFGDSISRGSYVYSNLAFSIPVLIPYVALSGLMDIVLILPFEAPKRLLSTTIGQTGYFLVFLLIAAIFAPVMVKTFWRCRPLPAGPVRARIEALCRYADVTCADIVYWPIFGGRMITAGVMGLVGRFRYILITEALLDLLRPEEVDQVIVHEIGHVKRKHLLLYLLFLIGFMLVSYVLSIVSYYAVFLTPFSLRLIFEWELNPANVLTAVSAVTLVIGVIVYFRYIFGYFMRNFERQADGYVFKIFDSAQPLINTFGKIALSSGQAADKPNWHHFSIQQRIDHLRRCEWSRANIARHDRKVRNSIGVYLIALAVMGFAVVGLNQYIYSQSNSELALKTLEIYLDEKQPHDRQDALLFLMVGNLHVERKNVARAAAAYEQGLALDTTLPDLHNNLAWLLATSDSPDLRDPVRALALAERAIALKKGPHIWDTLAEAYFANQRYEEAVEAARQALAMNPGDRTLYEKQLARFKSAAGAN
jgi:Zn-dependent protease with chaperone function